MICLICVGTNNVWYVLVSCVYEIDDIDGLLLQKPMVNALSEVRQAITQLTSNPAEFDQVMSTLVNVLTDCLHDNSIVEAIVENLFLQVYMYITWSHDIRF